MEVIGQGVDYEKILHESDEERDIIRNEGQGELTFRELQLKMEEFFIQYDALDDYDLVSQLLYEASMRKERAVDLVRSIISRFIESQEEKGVHFGKIEYPYDHETLEEALFEESYGLSFLSPYFKSTTTESVHVDGEDLYITRFLQGERKEDLLIDIEAVEALQDRMIRLQRLSLNEEHPACETYLHDGTRVVLVIPPESSTRQIIIRRFNLLKPTYELLASEFETFPDTPQWKRFFELYMRARLNLLVIGSPDSGKSTTLKALFSLKRDEDGVVTIEPHFELNLKKAFRRMRKGKIIELQLSGSQTYEQLFERGLRANVKCIIVPEVRSFEEALIFVRALERGLAGSLCTFHTSNSEQVPIILADLARSSPHNAGMSENRITRNLHGVLKMETLLNGQRKMTKLISYEWRNQQMVELPVVQWRRESQERLLATRSIPEGWKASIEAHLNDEERAEFQQFFEKLLYFPDECHQMNQEQTR